jgi:hypothetical protein
MSETFKAANVQGSLRGFAAAEHWSYVGRLFGGGHHAKNPLD